MTSYRIVRFYRDAGIRRRVIETGLTLEQAQARATAGTADGDLRNLLPVMDEHDKWCFGILDPESVAAQVDALRPGQRVRATFEFVVAEPILYPNEQDRRPAVSGGSGDGHVVLRYTGSHPATAGREKDPHVEGKIHGSLVAVEVVPDGT